MGQRKIIIYIHCKFRHRSGSQKFGLGEENLKIQIVHIQIKSRVQITFKGIESRGLICYKQNHELSYIATFAK